MPYNKLHLSVETKIIGRKYPQCKGVPNGYNFEMYKLDNSMTKLNNKQFPSVIPNLFWELEDSAKLTDFISPSNICIGLLINEKVKNILENFELGNAKFYNAKIIFKEKQYNYFWLHIIDNGLEGVDYENSIFKEVDPLNNIIKEVDIKNQQEYFFYFDNRSELLGQIAADNLTLYPPYSLLDIIYSPKISSRIIVSEALKKALANINSVVFTNLLY